MKCAEHRKSTGRSSSAPWTWLWAVGSGLWGLSFPTFHMLTRVQKSRLQGAALGRQALLLLEISGAAGKLINPKSTTKYFVHQHCP